LTEPAVEVVVVDCSAAAAVAVGAAPFYTIGAGALSDSEREGQDSTAQHSREAAQRCLDERSMKRCL